MEQRKNQNLEFSKQIDQEQQQQYNQHHHFPKQRQHRVLSSKSEENIKPVPSTQNNFAVDSVKDGNATGKSTRPPRASGGDIAVTITAKPQESAAKLLAASNKSSYKSIAESPLGQEELEEMNYNLVACSTQQSMKTAKSHMSNLLESKQSSTANVCSKRSSKALKQRDVEDRIKSELSKYKKELKLYNNTTKDLEEKYHKINSELVEMQAKHERFLAKRKSSVNCERDSESDSSCSSSSNCSSQYSLKRKYTQVFHRGSSYLKIVPNEKSSSVENLSAAPYNSRISMLENQLDLPLRRNSSSRHVLENSQSKQYAAAHRREHNAVSATKKSSRRSKNKENEAPANAVYGAQIHRKSQSVSGLKDIYSVLRNVLDANEIPPAHCLSTETCTKELQSVIKALHNEKLHFRKIIEEQQRCLQEYHSRCLKAQHIMENQHSEIDKLNANNKQMESEINHGINQLRHKVDSRLKDVSNLPQMVREEQFKYAKLGKENRMLVERIHTLQHENNQFKQKLDELSKKKNLSLNRLKAAERDLKIFKNYNTALKGEKRRLHDDLQKARDQLDSLQNTSKRTMSRQREQNEKQRRDLQKRVFELELKLSRTQSSTSGLLQERDGLIVELQTQLNTLVHNFEVSQKHIRVLRRHIYSMTGGGSASNRASSRVLSETA